MLKKAKTTKNLNFLKTNVKKSTDHFVLEISKLNLNKNYRLRFCKFYNACKKSTDHLIFSISLTHTKKKHKPIHISKF